MGRCLLKRFVCLPSIVCVCLSLCLTLCLSLSLSHFSCATKQSSICHGSRASLRDATGGNARKSPWPSTGPRGSCSSSNSSSRLFEQTWSPQQMFTAFQQQLGQEMTDVIQQLRVEMNETVSGRMDMLNSINTALQSVSAKSTASKPY